MYEALCVLLMLGAVCFLFGVVYPVGVVLSYPIYKKFGGDMNFREYMSQL